MEPFFLLARREIRLRRVTNCFHEVFEAFDHFDSIKTPQGEFWEESSLDIEEFKGEMIGTGR
jgi:hypothetical protein